MRQCAAIVIIGILALGLARAPMLATSPVDDRSAADRPLELKGLYNVFRITDRLYSGSAPDDETGFGSLVQLGVKTVLSVDGMRPDVATARKYGLRYVHIPVRYDGITREQALRLARAVRDLPGPIYLHCHHGQHRAPAAAAVAHRCVDEHCTVAAALAELRRAGTDPHYAGLYAAVRDTRRPSVEELDRVPADFPEAAPVPALAQLMVDIDDRLEHLKGVRAAGWKTPPAHPDIDPPHEALQLAEGYREARRLAEASARPEDFRRRLGEAEQAVADLETCLRQRPVDPAAAERAFAATKNGCTHCHAKYRDTPEKP